LLSEAPGGTADFKYDITKTTTYHNGADSSWDGANFSTQGGNVTFQLSLSGGTSGGKYFGTAEKRAFNEVLVRRTTRTWCDSFGRNLAHWALSSDSCVIKDHQGKACGNPADALVFEGSPSNWAACKELCNGKKGCALYSWQGTTCSLFSKYAPPGSSS
jgi:hypothetical protein